MKTLAHVLCGLLFCLGRGSPGPCRGCAGASCRSSDWTWGSPSPCFHENPEAQQFFDQGLRFIYAFNHDEAARSFQHAAELDPKLAMAYWGVAEAVGPNYNDPADPDRYKHAHEAVQKAVDLSAAASPSDQAYIQALAKRFPADSNSDLKKAAEDYRDAMRQVVQRISRRPGRSHSLRRGWHEFASLGFVACRWHAGGRHGRNRVYAGIGDEARSQSSGCDPLLHPCSGGVTHSRARAGWSESGSLHLRPAPDTSCICPHMFTFAPATTKLP